MRPLKIPCGQSRAANPWGSQRYDSLQAKIQRRFRGGFSMLFSWNWSKLMGDASFWGTEISGPVAEHTLGSEDRPHEVSIAPVWEVPKVLDAVVGGWELRGQYVIQSGAPAIFSANSFFDGQAFGRSRNDRTLDRWFDTSHFSKFPNSQDNIAPVSASDPRNKVYADFGDFVRRCPTRWASVRASRVNDWLFKNFRVGERIKLSAGRPLCRPFSACRRRDGNAGPRCRREDRSARCSARRCAGHPAGG
jgi:hypothetical protein